jgi:glycosyltransferase involved in cell wall biosynthesis
MVHLTLASKSGAARYVYSLVAAMQKQDKRMTLICPEDFEFIPELQQLGVSIRANIPSLVPGNSFYLFWRMIRITLLASFEVLRAGPQDRVVQINFPYFAIFTIPMLMSLRLCGYKCVLTVHDVLPHKWILPESMRRAEMLSLRLLYMSAFRLVVLHSGAATILDKSFHVSPGKIVVIPHGTFSVGVNELEAPDTPEVTGLLFGTLRENKGILLAIAATQVLRSEGAAFRLRICGRVSKWEQGYWAKCKAQIAVRPDGIEVREGFIPSQDLKAELRRAHFLLLPYTDFSSQSGVAALALSNGRAIVATRSGGLTDLVTPQTGIEITEPTVESVVSALQAALGLRVSGLLELGLRARSYFVKNYSWDVIAKHHFALYEGIAV